MLNNVKCPKCGSTNECKDCGHLFTLPKEIPDEEMPVLTVPKTTVIKYGWVCPRCGKVNSPFVDHCDCKPEKKSNYSPDWLYRPTTTTPPSYNFNFTADACKNCRNNPANGGSGICNCMLGIMNKATCSIEN